MQPATLDPHTLSDTTVTWPAQTTKACRLCGSSDVEFGQLCEACKSDKVVKESAWMLAEPYPVAMVAPTSQVVDPPPTCLICGGPFEPYKIGRSFVQKPGQCQTCLMRKKYGPDWRPGGLKANRKPGNKKLPEQPGTNPTPDAQPAANPAPEPEVIEHSITLRFVGPDHGMFLRLKEIATKERRSLDQQVLFYLDSILKDGE